MITKIDSIVKDEKVYVDFEALLYHVFRVANTFSEMQHGSRAEEAAQRIQGIVDIGQGLEIIYQSQRIEHGLTK